MKSIIHKFSFTVLVMAGLLSFNEASAQIDYYDDFSADTQRWTELDFHNTDVAVCDNSPAFRANPVSTRGTMVPVESVSRSLGISNGEEVVLSYKYKLLDYDDVLPNRPLDDADWGMFTVEYGPTQNGPWTVADIISPENHYISNECAVRTVSFIPNEGEEVYLRLYAKVGTSPEVSYFVYVDDISLLQKSLTIDPIISYNNIHTYPDPVDDYLHIEYDGFINDVVIYDMQGQEVNVEDIDNDLRRLDMSGLAFGQYVLKITADERVNTLYIQKE